MLAKCPYCENGEIEILDREVQGKKVKLYRCCNMKWQSEDGEFFERREDSTCSFQIWANSLWRYGKWLSTQEVAELLREKELEVELISKKHGKKIEYTKKITLHEEYGVTVVWE
ncbi:MAG: hypothetical protein IE916_10900 [Epsilonproteobacteria bacterium]|nr:hypothetical protein [Campylobacterota bacterium]